MADRFRVKVSIYVGSDIALFMRAHGEAKKTDLVAGRYNWSRICEEYLRQFIAAQEPIVIAQAYKQQKDRLLLEVRELDERARMDLGTTIEDFLSSHSKSIADQVGEAKDRAKARAAEILIKIQDAYRLYVNGGRRSIDPHRARGALDSWIRGRFSEELKVLGMTAAELANTLEKQEARI